MSSSITDFQYSLQEIQHAIVCQRAARKKMVQKRILSIAEQLRAASLPFPSNPQTRSFPSLQVRSFSSKNKEQVRATADLLEVWCYMCKKHKKTALSEPYLDRRLQNNQHIVNLLKRDLEKFLIEPRQGIAHFMIAFDPTMQPRAILKYVAPPYTEHHGSLFIDFLATAPCNLLPPSSSPRVRYCAATLLQHAVYESRVRGLGGSLELKSTSQSTPYYEQLGFAEKYPTPPTLSPLTPMHLSPTSATELLHNDQIPCPIPLIPERVSHLQTVLAIQTTLQELPLGESSLSLEELDKTRATLQHTSMQILKLQSRSSRLPFMTQRCLAYASTVQSMMDQLCRSQPLFPPLKQLQQIEKYLVWANIPPLHQENYRQQLEKIREMFRGYLDVKNRVNQLLSQLPPEKMSSRDPQKTQFAADRKQKEKLRPPFSMINPTPGSAERMWLKKQREKKPSFDTTQKSSPSGFRSDQKAPELESKVV